MVGKVARKRLKKPKQQLTKRTIMTTETQTISPKKISNNNSIENKTSAFEERKIKVMKPLSLRPNRSIKKNSSLKPIGLKAK